MFVFQSEREKIAGKLKNIINKQKKHPFEGCFLLYLMSYDINWIQNLNTVVKTAPNMSSSVEFSTSVPPKIAGLTSIESLGLKE